MLEKTLIDLAHRHFKIMWRYEAMTNSIIIHVENNMVNNDINKITESRLKRSAVPVDLSCL